MGIKDSEVETKDYPNGQYDKLHTLSKKIYNEDITKT